MLRAADRLLSLLASAPGGIALHGSGDALILAGTLISTCLIARWHFTAAEAAAWLRLTCSTLLCGLPPLPALPDDFYLAHAPADGEPGAALLARCCSAPRAATAPAGVRGAPRDFQRPPSLPEDIL